MATIAKTIPHAEETNTRHLARLSADDWWFGRAALAYVGIIEKTDLAAVKREIKAGVARGLSDSGITNAIVTKFWNKQPRGESSGRGAYRAGEIAPFVTAPVARYLDFGCGDRTITEAVGRYYGLDRENIIGVDLFDSGATGSIFYNTTAEIPSGRVDLITAFVSLHHVADQAAQIAEFARILAPGGTIVIREHDASYLHSGALMFDYLQHIHIVAAVWDTEGALADILRGTTYRPQYEWTELFARAGLTQVAIKRPDPKLPNPQGLYYASYAVEK
jgi:SAM-dependent methyltransferase